MPALLDLDATVLAAGMAAFGETVLWLSADCPSQSVAAIFFDGAVETTLKDGVEVTERVSRIDTRVNLFPRAPRQGDLCQARARLYAVTEAVADGVGGITLRLRFATDDEARRAQAPATPLAAP